MGALLTGSFGNRGVPIGQPKLSNEQRSGSALAAKKLLVCAPSNAAVDELVMRFKEGVKTADGTQQKISVIRLGRSDAINANVMDVTLEELVNAKLNLASGKKNAADDIHKIMIAHKAVSEELNALRSQVDELKANAKPVSSDQERQFEVLKRKKQQLSNQIDATRDNGDVVARDAELSRRGVQQEILNGAHVICATLSGSGHEIFQGLNIEFETVIIDEAAQSIELSALIPLKYGCSKCILVGDPKQLPPTVLSREAARFQYEQSLFVRMQGNHPGDVHLLDTQYRMHPEISAFPSNAFYEARLLDGPGMAKLRARPWHQNTIFGPYRFFDVQGHHQSAPRGHSLINHAEIEIALKLFDRLVTDCKGYDFRGKVGVITPYKSQLRELRFRFSQRYGDSVFAGVEFNTTDAFQGRESEIIIFSCVRASFSKGIGFLSDIRRMNVGITRAKCSLWVLGNSQSLMQGEFWSRLIQDAKSRDRYTSGDLLDLLRMPVLSIDSAAPATVNNYPSSQDHDIAMPDAPVLQDPMSVSSKRGSATTDDPQDSKLPGEHLMTYQPAGGGNGLNANDNCHKCGSFTHRTQACDNSDARAQIAPQCFRCKADGHTKAFCTVDRCFTCGDFGHTQKLCASTKYLSNKEKLKIGKQEAEHNILLQHAPELHRKRQLGDHDRQVPIVRSTSSTPLPNRTATKVSGHSLKAGEKRRRGSSPPAAAPKGPKIIKDNPEVTQHKSGNSSTDTNMPLSQFPNGVTNRDHLGPSGQQRAPSRSTSTAFISSGSDGHGPIADTDESSKYGEIPQNITRFMPAAPSPRPESHGSSPIHPNGLTINPRQNGTLVDRSSKSHSLPKDISARQADSYSMRKSGSYRPSDIASTEQAKGHNIGKKDSDQTEIGARAAQTLKDGEGIKNNETLEPSRAPNMVRMPKRKKEADPFIRPKKRP